jgi:hypothetical protein
LVACASGGATPAARTGNDADDSADESIAAPNTAVHKSGSGTVAAVLGSPGGTLELNGGPRVEIPPGAVEGAEEFVLKVAQKTTAFGNKESEKAVGPTFSVAPGADAPDGRMVVFSLPMASFPDGWGDPALAYELDQGEVVGGEDSTRTRWQYEPARLSGGRIVAELPGVPGLRLQFVLSNLEAQ